MLNYYVSVFFKTHRLSENFVLLSAERCPFSAWFPTSKNSISATFPPICPPCTNPHHFSLSGGILRSRIPKQSIALFVKIPYHLVQISACPGVRAGGVRGVNGDKFRDFSAKASPWKGENWGTFWGWFGGSLGEKWGKNRVFLSTSGTLRNRISPAIPSAFSSVFFPFQSVPAGRIYTKNQAVPFKIEAFPGGIITCTGQERGAFQGRIRAFSLEESLGKGLNWGGLGDGNKGFLHEGYPWKGENRGP